MDKLYKKLYEEYIEKAGKTPIDKAAIFVPMRGKQYHPSNKIRLMIVGRAPNGWNSKIDYSTGEVFGNSAKELYEDRKRFTWIKEAECLYHYFLSGSAFWRVTKKIWTTLSKIDDEEWYEYIAWTNLYKISNQEGNPSGNMYYAQIDSLLLTVGFVRNQSEIFVR